MFSVPAHTVNCQIVGWAVRHLFAKPFEELRDTDRHANNMDLILSIGIACQNQPAPMPCEHIPVVPARE